MSAVAEVKMGFSERFALRDNNERLEYFDNKEKRVPYVNPSF